MPEAREANMIPEFLLEEILLGEKNEKDYYEKYGREEIQSALAELRKSNEEILEMYPAEQMHDKAIAKAFAQKNPAADKKARTFEIWKCSAAALLLFAFASPLVVKNLTVEQNSPAVRVKGNAHHQIRLYRKSGDEALLLKNGEVASENDLIQITYTPGKYNYGVIFSVDGNGNLTRHFPENSWKAAKLEKTGEEVPLSFSYSLDDAPKYECFIFVASKNSFDMSDLEKIKADSYSIDFLEKGSYLPKNCDGSIFVLNKK